MAESGIVCYSMSTSRTERNIEVIEMKTIKIHYENKKTNNIEAIAIPDLGEDYDVWSCISEFDRVNRTDYYSKIENIFNIEVVEE